MKRKWLAALMASLCLVSVMAGTVAARSVAGGAGGPCVDAIRKDYVVGKLMNRTVSGISAQVDPANTGSDDLCDWNFQPIPNNGIIAGVVLAQNSANCGSFGDSCGQILFGVTNCDYDPLISYMGCSRNEWHFTIVTTDCHGGDSAYNYGTSVGWGGGTVTSAWSPHDFQIIFHYGLHRYDFAIDGHVLAHTQYVGYNGTGSWDCMNLDQSSGSANGIQAQWDVSRWDGGDAVSYNGVNPWDQLNFTAMKAYLGGGQWVLPSSLNCTWDLSNDTHPMPCDGNGSYSQMRVWSVY